MLMFASNNPGTQAPILDTVQTKENNRVTEDWTFSLAERVGVALLGLTSLVAWVFGSGQHVSSQTGHFLAQGIFVFLAIASAVSLLVLIYSGKLARNQISRAAESARAWRSTCDELRRLVERRDAEIQRQEEELADLFHSSSVGLHILGADGTILIANKTEMEFLGRDPEEYIGQNIAAFHIESATCAEMLRRLSNLETLQNFPVRLRHKDGSVRHALIDAKARLKDGCFLHALCFTRDVTERTWADDQMLAYQREVSHLKATLHEHAIVTITDPQGRITYVNDNMCAVSKYSREELVGQDHRIMNSGYHSREFMKELWETISRGKVWKGEIRNRAKDGSFFWVDTTIVPFLGADDQPLQYFAIHADITARKQARLAVETISERLRLATEGSGVGIWDWDLSTRNLIWDDMMFRLYGMDPAKHPPLDKAWESALHPEDRDRACAEVRQSLRDRQTYDTAFRVIWPNGSVRHIRAHAIVQRDKTGKAIRMTGTNWDITDHRVAEEKLAASLHEKEVLLKEIHHRVKNNMQVVFSLLSLQSDQIADPEAVKAFRESQNRVKSMALLHEKLYQSENLARIDFARYLGSLLDHLFQSFGSSAAHVQRVIDVPGVSLGLDTAIPCGLIVNELVSNALKYAFVGRDHGQVQLRMRADADRRYHLVVWDDGVGLPKEVDFRQAKTLGLQLVNMLTNQLHGSVEYRNGSGTEFHIVFEDRQHIQKN
jgi:PAS domain S-box-containing protein